MVDVGPVLATWDWKISSNLHQYHVVCIMAGNGTVADYIGIQQGGTMSILLQLFERHSSCFNGTRTDTDWYICSRHCIVHMLNTWDGGLSLWSVTTPTTSQQMTTTRLSIFIFFMFFRSSYLGLLGSSDHQSFQMQS